MRVREIMCYDWGKIVRKKDVLGKRNGIIIGRVELDDFRVR